MIGKNHEKVLSAVWGVPSLQAAQDAIREITAKRYELRPGSFATRIAFYSAQDDEGHCVILVGYGSMFDGGFLARCGMCVEQQGGARLPQSQRTQRMVEWAHSEWQKSQKEERRKARRLLAETKRNAL